ncbi:MAG: hypothetical protein BroJett040_25670 [Oligoflexia bacterium]|nr:MAG: hypothetical protein BroJett040_25670 [Oligoflexia bacterium]
MKRSLLLSLFLLILTATTEAGDFRSVSVEGQIFNESTGLPLTATSVDFTVSVYSPGSPKCLLWKETHNKNLSSTDGLFNLTLGSGTKVSGVTSFTSVFNNTSGALTSLSCDSGSSYTPALTDDRLIKVEFNDGSGLVSLSEQDVKAVPFAMYAEKAGEALKVGGAEISSTAPTNGQALIYNSTSQKWEPTVLSGGGTVTGVSSANSDISVSVASPNPQLTLNSGTGANQIVKLDGAAKLPAVDASQLTNLDATKITSGTLPITRGGTGTNTLPSCTAGQAIKYDGTSWSCVSTSSGSVSSVDVSLPTSVFSASSGAITSSGTISFTLNAQNNNQVFAGPSSGGPLAPAFRYLSISDIRSSSAPATNSFLSGAGCTAGQALTYSSVSDQISCTTIAPDWGSITSKPTTLSGYGITDAINKSGDTMTGNLIHGTNTGAVFNNTANTFGVTVKAPSGLGSNLTLILPSDAGANNYVLKTDGAGNLSWSADATGGSPGDASYASKGIVQFNTDAATSGISVAAGVASVNAGTTGGAGDANKIVKLNGSGQLASAMIPTLNQNTTGNAATATALAADPADCGLNTFATTIAANGDLACTAVGVAAISGTLPVSKGGTGTANGSITGSTALSFAAGGINQDINLNPSGTGAVIINGASSVYKNLQVRSTANYTNAIDVSISGAGTNQQSSINLTTSSSGGAALGNSSVIGWELTGISNSNSATALQNAFQLNYVNNSAWANAITVLPSASPKVGIGTTAPSEKLEIAGNVKADGVRLGASGIVTGASCTAGEAGTMKYDATNLRMIYCDGANWMPMTNFRKTQYWRNTSTYQAIGTIGSPIEFIGFTGDTFKLGSGSYSELYIPSGVKKIRICFGILITNSGSANSIELTIEKYNGAAWQVWTGMPRFFKQMGVSESTYHSGCGAVFDQINTGDKFRIFGQTTAGSTNVGGNNAWLSIEEVP